MALICSDLIYRPVVSAYQGNDSVLQPCGKPHVQGAGAYYTGYPLGDGEREGGQSQPTHSDLEARDAALAHLATTE